MKKITKTTLMTMKGYNAAATEKIREIDGTVRATGAVILYKDGTIAPYRSYDAAHRNFMNLYK